MKVIAIDKNHPVLIDKLSQRGFEIKEAYDLSKKEISEIIENYEGMIIRSRFPVDSAFLGQAKKLKFIGRVGAGMENIDVDYAQARGISLFNAPEGNRDAVAEHALGMLLALMNRFLIADKEVRNGKWRREENRGDELMGKTVGIIGYGNMGKAFAKRLSGFGVRVICYDILEGVGDGFAQQVGQQELFDESDVLSLHTPQTPLTMNMINTDFINQFKKPFYFINTARGKSVVTADLLTAIKSGKIKGAGLDVLEFEKSSFENIFQTEIPRAFEELLSSEKVILSPHVAGWTHESKYKLSKVIADKIIAEFG